MWYTDSIFFELFECKNFKTYAKLPATMTGRGKGDCGGDVAGSKTMGPSKWSEFTATQILGRRGTM